MSEVLELENAIHHRLPGYCWGPFPSADIRKLCPEHTIEPHTAFDLYFAEIAGYTVNVKTIRRKQKDELLHMKDRLSRSFFERYSGYDGFRKKITPENTPDLYRHLTAAEANRLDLLKLIDALIENMSA